MMTMLQQIQKINKDTEILELSGNFVKKYQGNNAKFPRGTEQYV